jgi:hypothetical protein
MFPLEGVKVVRSVSTKSRTQVTTTRKVVPDALQTTRVIIMAVAITSCCQ